ncbi:MAG: hypothetical protein KME31_34720 [Tolypothrix carrinoi HA7290-LM1]|nr:hypothetical protein [Tolypothrix carrinoi HA7290-LM1]
MGKPQDRTRLSMEPAQRQWHVYQTPVLAVRGLSSDGTVVNRYYIDYSSIFSLYLLKIDHL